VSCPRYADSRMTCAIGVGDASYTAFTLRCVARPISLAPLTTSARKVSSTRPPRVLCSPSRIASALRLNYTLMPTHIWTHITNQRGVETVFHAPLAFLPLTGALADGPTRAQESA
jgi:hypothetical protein